jgi:hypothetical protein
VPPHVTALVGYLQLAQADLRRHQMLREDDMSETGNGKSPELQPELDAERQEIADVEEKLDAQSDGEGLAAEAGRSEETGLAEG